MRRAGAKEGCDGADSKAVGPPSSSGPTAQYVRWSEDRDMEDLVTEMVADQELKVGDENKAGFVAALARNPSGHIGRENLTGDDAEASDALKSAGELNGDLFRNFERLKKDEALARLLELEEDREKTFFEMGCVLSLIQKRKWFDPFDSLDEWVEKNTAIGRAKARALIQIYDTIVKSGIKWADIQHAGWTKLRAMACVLNQETADRWIEIASRHSRAEVVKLVREHSLQSKQKHCAQPDTQVKTFRLQDGQSQCIRAAIDKAKKFNDTDRDSAALEAICQNYIEGHPTMTEEALVNVLVEHLNTLDEHAAVEFMSAVRGRVTHAL
jgi:hypothetical protein